MDFHGVARGRLNREARSAMAQRQVPREEAAKAEVNVPPKPAVEATKAGPTAAQAAPAPEPEKKRAPGNSATAATAQAAGQKQQDEMLQWIQGRLTTVAEVQRREVEQTSHRNRRAWWDEVADTHKQRVSRIGCQRRF